MDWLLSLIRKFLGMAVCLALIFTARTAGAAEGLQKLRVAYAAITAALSRSHGSPKKAGIFQRHGLDVEIGLHRFRIARGCRLWWAAALTLPRSAVRQESMPSWPARIRSTLLCR